MSLPRSASLSLWLRACLHGTVPADDFAAQVRAEDPQHLVVGWPGQADAVGLLDLPALVRGLVDPVITLALPAPGDPLGLAGPPPFNGAALDAGEAVLLTGRAGALGLVPVLDARTVLWQAYVAERPPLLDPGEASRALRQTLISSTAELVRLDVASWQPEIPDLLLNLSRRPGLPLPPGTTAAATETLERAALCLEIVDLAHQDDGGAVSAHDVRERSRCLTDLDVAARRAVVAFCSASLSAS